MIDEVLNEYISLSADYDSDWHDSYSDCGNTETYDESESYDDYQPC